MRRYMVQLWKEGESVPDTISVKGITLAHAWKAITLHVAIQTYTPVRIEVNEI